MSPTKRPVLVPRRTPTDDFELKCPDKAEDSGKPPLPPKCPKSTAQVPRKRSSEPDVDDTATMTVAKKSMILREHDDGDRCARVNDLISASKATIGFFLEIFPSEDQVSDAGERWFAEIIESKIHGVNPSRSVRAKWCKTNTLSPQVPIQSTQVFLKNVKDYGPKANFI